MPAIQIFDNEETLADQAAELFVQAAQEAIAARGRFTVALAGGKTPEKAYTRLFRQLLKSNGTKSSFFSAMNALLRLTMSARITAWRDAVC